MLEVQIWQFPLSKRGQGGFLTTNTMYYSRMCIHADTLKYLSNCHYSIPLDVVLNLTHLKYTAPSTFPPSPLRLKTIRIEKG